MVSGNSRPNYQFWINLQVLFYRYFSFKLPTIFMLPVLLFVILCMIFQEKCFSYYILLTDQVSFFLSLPLEILGNMCIAILPPSCDVINIGIKLMYLIKSFFNMIKKSRQKYLTIINLKISLKIEKNSLQQKYLFIAT